MLRDRVKALFRRGEQAGIADQAPNSPYRAGATMNQEMFGYRPGLLSADAAIRPARDLALSRARDLYRNDPHAKAGVQRLVDMLVGAGIRLVAKPDYRALGITADQAREVRSQIEAEWRLATQDPRFLFDAERKVSLNGRLRQLARTWSIGGEVTCVLKWREENIPGARYRTNLLAISPDRLSTPAGRLENISMRQGIEYDAAGLTPIAYHVRDAHPSDYYSGISAWTWTRIPRETAWGRPIFIHGFEPEQEGQSRAITPFAALVQRLRMIGKYADTELANAAVNALFAAFVSSNMSLQDATAKLNVANEAYVDARDSYWEAHPPTLGGVRIPVLPIGDELKINAQPRATTAFPAFQTAFLRSIAAALGISYEQLSMDWSQTNYSSARAALNEVWRGIRRDFAAFCEQVVTPIYLAFLEEAFDRYITLPAGAPTFWDMPAAWAAARWIGSPRGYVDPTKEAEAADMRVSGLTSTLESENAEQGLDWEETIEQAAYEQEVMKRAGVVRAPAAPKPTADETNTTTPETAK
ncbi:phage portal protein [Labrys sp. WJW]|uniref:phage portal protein n=1 Tax=Labrys sp. WJW TaxID=1737983 RepID=UPI0008336E53|nr:phage portal protein [Labrys sp. WJW]OCC05250.1 phage portal protein [Labrys sp. WJW]